MILSSPADQAYVPGYYSNAGLVTLKWREATRITLTDQSQIDNINCTHRARKVKSGILQFNGNVSEKFGTSQKKNNPLGENYLNGVNVYMVDTDGNVVDNVITDNNGSFLFTEIADGTYKLVIDKFGYEPYETNIETDFGAKANQNFTFSLVKTASLAVNDPTDISISDIKVAPTPVENSAILMFNSIEANVNIDIVNSLGTKFVTIIKQTVEGLNTVKLPVDGLSSGMYFAVIRNGSSVKTVSFVVSK